MTTERLPDTMTLGEVRAILKNKWKEGCICGACGQRVQLYSRPITSSMAYGLILFYRRNHSAPSMYIHVENFLKHQDVPSSIRGDFPKLRFWGLIEQDPNNDGYYRVTDKGVRFVKGEIKVESNVMTYNNKSYGFKGKYVDIRECLKKKFDYELLMEGTL